MDIGPSDAETFCTTFLRKLARRCLRDVKLVDSDARRGHRGYRRQDAQRELAEEPHGVVEEVAPRSALMQQSSPPKAALVARREHERDQWRGRLAQKKKKSDCQPG